MGLALPSVAAADSYTNAGYLNAGYLNAGYLNAGYLNAGYLNAGYLNAGYLNGGSLGGVTLGKMTTAQGQPIDSVVVTKDYLSGSAWVWEFDHITSGQIYYAWHYRALGPTEFLNATFDATVNDSSTDTLAGAITLKITEIKTIAGEDGTTHYQHVIKWKDAQSGTLTPLCGCENNNPTCTAPVPATLTQGQWNYQIGAADGGRKISNDPNLLTVACAGGAISKCSSDKNTFSPLTPYYSGTVAPAAATWVNKGAWIVYPNEQITVRLTGVTGDPDLYVRWNDQPNASSWNCRPYAGANTAETCTLTVPSYAYYAYISVYGYAAASATLTVTSTNATPRGMDYVPYGSMNCFILLGGGMHCNTSPATENQSCTRMVTADYCGDGTPHTVTGRPIEVYDYFSPTVNDLSPDPVADMFESEWTPDGANSIGTCRVNDLDLSAANPQQCPVYNGTQHQVAHYIMINTPYGTTACAADQSNSGVYTDRSGYLYNYNTGTYYPRTYTRVLSKGF